MKRLSIAAMLALAACRPAAEPPLKQRPPQAVAAVAQAFRPPITARGNEPFWALKIDADGMVLSRPAEPDVRYPVDARTAGPRQATWTAAGVGGPRVTLRVEPCSDGMSDMRYPMSAVVQGLGGEILRGCAFRDDEPPASPG